MPFTDQFFATATLDERARALKERIYATFTGLAILGAVSLAEHTTAADATLSVATGVLGISVAGFLAEVVAHQVTHQALPAKRELLIMMRIALGALSSASTPVVLLVLAWAGVLPLEWAVGIGIAVYAVILVVVMLLAGHRAGLRPLQQLVATAMLLGLALVVMAILLLAHGH